MKYGVLASAILWCAAGTAIGQVSIGIHIGSSPNLVVIPGYPVYYAPGIGSNYFFFDGMYWVYQEDGWYSSSGYNGPWEFVDPMYVPIELLQVPVRYYRQPPVYFRAWQSDRPPRWEEHWGQGWAQRRSGWDQQVHHDRPAAAPPAQAQRLQDQRPQEQRGPVGDNPARAQQPSPMRDSRDRHPPSNNAHSSPGQSPAQYRPAASPSAAPAQQGASAQHGHQAAAPPHPSQGMDRSAAAPHSRESPQGGHEQGGHLDDKQGTNHQ